MRRTYVAVDLETTGLDSERDAILEIGAVKFRGEEVLDTWSSFVNPYRLVPYKITQLTGIADDHVQNAPSLSAVLPDLIAFVGRAPVVGHNVQFDLSFLTRHGALADAEAVDTFELASILVPHAPRYSLSVLAATLDIPHPVQHRALEDALTTQRLFHALTERALALNTELLAEIARLAQQSNWQLWRFLDDVLNYKQRTAFVSSSIGQQMASKRDGDVDGLGLMLLQDEEMPPLRPRVETLPVDEEALAAVLESTGEFARLFPHFEHRPQQVAMLRAVAQSLNQGYHLLVEAGTGTGKSLAYLLPAVHFALQNERPVVISTNTINLQEQLVLKDIPDIQKTVPASIRVALLKGRGNYLCLRRLAAMRARKDLSEDEVRALAKMLIWQQTTTTGDVSELFLPSIQERAAWRQVASEHESCLAEDCPHREKGRCFFYRARRRAERAHIIVVNHALLLADVAVENRVLPEYKHLVIDEAHHLEDAITRQLSFQADHLTVDRQLGDISQKAGSGRYRGFLTDVAMRCRGAVPEHLYRDLTLALGDAQKDVDTLQRVVHDFFVVAEEFAAEHQPEGRNTGYSQRLRITKGTRAQPGWSLVENSWQDCTVMFNKVEKSLERVYHTLEALEGYDIPEFEATIQDLASHVLHLRSMRDQIGQIVSRPGDNHIYWFEVNQATGALTLNAAPLHVGDLMREHIFGPKESVILTSATLQVGESFDYIRERLGAWEADGLAVGSPFDYKASTLVYVPTDMPEPHQPYYQRSVEEALIELCKATAGRTLALFTSYSQLRATSRAISAALADEDILVLAHGEGASRNQLLETFRETERAVLLGTRSFWEGIDVMGEALSCLVIARLPFAVPTDPVFAARSETFEDPFNEYAVPESVLRFRQGFGRLIRSRDDRGVVVVMDRRIISKAYGRVFLESLPACTVRRAPLAELPRAASLWIDGEKSSPTG